MITVNIPKSLRKGGKFCVWKYIDRDGHKTKCPYDPHTGQFGASNDPKAFSSFSHAHLVLERYGYDGLGVGIFGDVCAIDLDDCITADGKLSEKAKDIISRMHSYTELSPSGKGIHILFRAPHFDYDKSKYYINNQSEGIEAYIAGATNKFVTITGKRLVGSPHDLQERSSQLSEVLETYMRRREWDRGERQEGEFTDLHTVQSAGDLFGDGLAVFLADTQAEGHVVEHGHVGPQGVRLEYQIQVALAGRGERSLRRVDDLLAVHQDNAVLGLFQAGDHAEGGGLAAAGGPQQGHEVAVLNGEVDVPQDVVAAVKFINVLQFNAAHIIFPFCSVTIPGLTYSC